jgi:hypothetical protein
MKSEVRFLFGNKIVDQKVRPALLAVFRWQIGVRIDVFV